MGFTDSEIDSLALAVKTDPKRVYGTPYIEKLLENLASVKFESNALREDTKRYRELYTEQKDIVASAISSAATVQSEMRLEIDRLQKLVADTKHELDMYPKRMRDKYQTFCKDCRYAKKGFFFLICRRFPARQMTFGWRSCGEAMA